MLCHLERKASLHVTVWFRDTDDIFLTRFMMERFWFWFNVCPNLCCLVPAKDAELKRMIVHEKSDAFSHSGTKARLWLNVTDNPIKTLLHADHADEESSTACPLLCWCGGGSGSCICCPWQRFTQCCLCLHFSATLMFEYSTTVISTCSWLQLETSKG